MAQIIPFRPKGMPELPPAQKVQKKPLQEMVERCQQLCDEMRGMITELEYLTEERMKLEDEQEEASDHAE